MAGGIPLIRPLRESLAGDRIRRVMGIVNGTTNYILTQMTEHGASFADALAEAQGLGYAEADPTADVEGFDAAAKARSSRRSRSARGSSRATCTARASRGITRDDIAVAARPRLRREAARDRGGVRQARSRCACTRRWSRRRHPLASVRDAFNAVFIEGDAVGELMFYGRGAGGEPTGAAVLGDLVDAAKHTSAADARARRSARWPRPADPRRSTRSTSQFYLKLEVADRPGVLAAIAERVRRNGVSISASGRRGRARTPASSSSPTARRRARSRRPCRRCATSMRSAPSGRCSAWRARSERGRRHAYARRAPWRGLIEEYREHLPVTDATPVVTLLEGGTPLLRSAAPVGAAGSPRSS